MPLLEIKRKEKGTLGVPVVVAFCPWLRNLQKVSRIDSRQRPNIEAHTP